MAKSPTKKKSKPVSEAISPKEYAATLAKLELVSVALLESHCRFLDRGAFHEAESLVPRLEINCPYNHASIEGGFVLMVVNHYRLEFSNEKGVPTLEFDFAFQTDFTTSDKVSPGFFEAFKEGALKLVVTPYARELVQNLSVRMEIPPIIMPLIRINQPTESE